MHISVLPNGFIWLSAVIFKVNDSILVYPIAENGAHAEMIWTCILYLYH